MLTASPHWSHGAANSVAAPFCSAGPDRQCRLARSVVGTRWPIGLCLPNDQFGQAHGEPRSVHPTFTVTAIRGDAWTGTLARVFEALSNFRDVGGHVTADGRKLRSGLVYRSDALCFVTERDRALLRDTLRIRTIVDLRTSMEHERMGRYDLTDVGEVVHLPVLDGALISEKAHDGSLDLASMYQAIAFDHADEIALVLTLLADPDRLPAIISCTAGKDRTGIVVGVLLAMLSVPEETVLADYEQSAAGLATLRGRILARLIGDDVPNIPAAAFALEPAALAQVLQDIRAAPWHSHRLPHRCRGASRDRTAVTRTSRQFGRGGRLGLLA